jgi:hypothetical protein
VARVTAFSTVDRAAQQVGPAHRMVMSSEVCVEDGALLRRRVGNHFQQEPARIDAMAGSKIGRPSKGDRTVLYSRVPTNVVNRIKEEAARRGLPYADVVAEILCDHYGEVAHSHTKESRGGRSPFAIITDGLKTGDADDLLGGETSWLSLTRPGTCCSEPS